VTLGIKRVPVVMPDAGPVTWAAMRDLFERYHRKILADLDIRNPGTEFAPGIVSNGNGVTVGTGASLTGRPSSSVPTVLAKITDAGRAQDQRFLQTSAVLSASSIQNINPVTSTAGASTASVDIASHNVVADFGTVAYNGGSIAGLSLNTAYYIYADDPDMAGGAVSYLASTDRTIPVASAGRYFVGSITTPATATTSFGVTGATSANPISITTAAPHAWVNGDSVQFSFLPGDFGTNLNGNTYVITVTGGSTFTIAVNGGAFAAYTSGGTAQRVAAPKNSQALGTGGGWVGFAPLLP